MIRLVAGLGNPDEKYVHTRHNIGFMVMDLVAQKLGLTFSNKFEGEYAFIDLWDRRIFFIKPMTYMNLSGRSVGGVASFYKIEPEEVLVIQDEMNIPFGTMKIRKDGSAGGHNGLVSIIEYLGSSNYPRLKMGIGKPNSSNDNISHVLGKFSPIEKETMEEFLNKGKEATLSILKDGLQKAMNIFNVKIK